MQTDVRRLLVIAVGHGHWQTFYIKSGTVWGGGIRAFSTEGSEKSRLENEQVYILEDILGLHLIRRIQETRAYFKKNS